MDARNMPQWKSQTYAEMAKVPPMKKPGKSPGV
jgi:hypothetical protein